MKDLAPSAAAANIYNYDQTGSTGEVLAEQTNNSKNSETTQPKNSTENTDSKQNTKMHSRRLKQNTREIERERERERETASGVPEPQTGQPPPSGGPLGIRPGTGSACVIASQTARTNKGREGEPARYRKSPRKGPGSHADRARAGSPYHHHGAVSQDGSKSACTCSGLLNTPVTTKPSSRTAAKTL